MLQVDYSLGAAGRRPAAGETTAQGKAETDAGASISAASWADLEKGRNSLVDDSGMQARAVVANGHGQPPARQGDVQMDPAVGCAARVLDRIIDQVRQDLIDHREIHPHAALAVDRPDDELHAGLEGVQAEPRGQAVE